MTGRSGNALLLAALFGLYVLTGKLGLSVAFVHASATAVWPPTGIALAAFLTLGYECWPAIFAGAFVVNISTAGSVATSLGIATGNTLEGLLGAYLVNRFGTGVRTFERAQDVFKFAGLAAVLSTIVGATTGVASLSLAGHAAWADWGRIWLTWWLGDMTGALIVAPLLILWIQNPRPDLVRRRPLEAACLCLVTILVGLAVFGEGVVFFGLRTFLLTFFCTLPLLWAAFRFRQREAAVLIAVLSGIAIWAMLRGSGPFAGVTANESLLLLQSFMGTVSVMILSAAALVEERRRVERDREDLLAREQAARAEAEGAGRAKDEFLAMLGYELRNPLAIIISAVSVLDRIESQEDFAVRARGAIRHQITHLSRLVDDLLDVAHVASGKIVLSCQPLNLATSVQRCVSVLAGTGRLERAKQEGLGVGLTLVRRLVGLHGGRVEASSDGPGRGSEFVVRLPRIAPAPAEDVARPPASQRHRILIVDDNPAARQMLRLTLELAGDEVEVAEDGHRALDLAESGWPEVVLIDTGLPGMDGYEVARRLRASSRGPEMHLLALTGFGQPRDYQRGPGSDFDAYLMKPVDPEELVRTIGTVAPTRVNNPVDNPVGKRGFVSDDRF